MVFRSGLPLAEQHVSLKFSFAHRLASNCSITKHLADQEKGDKQTRGLSETSVCDVQNPGLSFYFATKQDVGPFCAATILRTSLPEARGLRQFCGQG
jgi:hypothetical protein